MTLTVASMFSGIGLIDLGLERAGMETRLLCENDRAASTVLARRFPGIPIHPDIRELTADDLYAAGCQPDTTVAAAGFPCQDLSIAGSRRGMGEGTRSGLFWHVDRLLAEFAPRWVLLENVPGLLSSHGGRDMGAVLGALADRGYGYAYRVLDAQRFGVPQRRERVVIVGHLGEPWTAPAQVLLEPDCCGWDFATLRESGSRATGGAGAGSGVRRVAATLTAHHGRMTADEDLLVCYQRVIRSGARLPDGSLPPDKWERREIAATLSPFDLGSDSRAIELVAADTEVRRLTPLECERLQGAPDGWTGGQADSPRYKQLGNSVAVPVFEWVGRRIVAVDAQIRAERAA
jgi:DNA (cytosine-5)-methyltransferase 1